MGYNLDDKKHNTTLDLKNLMPYGDTMNDGKVQVSFTLPIINDEKGEVAAKELALNMGLLNPMVVEATSISDRFTFYILYGEMEKGIDYSTIHVDKVDNDVLDMHQIEDFIDKVFKRNLVVVGASTGTDAHTVGIDAIMNMKGFAGHYGLERYRNIDAYNMGSQVSNEALLKKAKALNADVLLISQTVTQKDVHIKNLVQLIELLEAENLRNDFIVIIGGPRISHELAKELGFDAGFGPKKFANDVASYFIHELEKRQK